jgi:competence protein ComEA
MRLFLNNYFGFNRQQRNGLLVLICISLFLLLFRIVYPHFLPRKVIVVRNFPLLELKTEKYADGHYENNTAKPQTIDPNTATAEQLAAGGLPEKIALRLIHFREKGFVFRKKEDLKKVYGINEKMFSRVLPFIQIAGKPSPPVKKAAVSGRQTKEVIDLNKADSALLTTLNGIGPGFARKIIKYRNLLGGYNSVEQLKEVYGFTAELFDKVKKYVTVDAAGVSLIDLNNDDFKVVNKHPYITYEMCKLIFNARRKEPLTRESLKVIMNDEALYAKLLPYLRW